MPKILCLVNMVCFSIVCSFVFMLCAKVFIRDRCFCMFRTPCILWWMCQSVSDLLYEFSKLKRVVSTLYRMFLVRTKRKINLFATTITEVGQGIACKRYEIGFEFGHIEPSFNLSQFYVIVFIVFSLLSKTKPVQWKMIQFVWNVLWVLLVCGGKYYSIAMKMRFFSDISKHENQNHFKIYIYWVRNYWIKLISRFGNYLVTVQLSIAITNFLSYQNHTYYKSMLVLHITYRWE